MMSDDKKAKQPKYEVPLWHKSNLSIEEAAAYSWESAEISYMK